MDTGEALSVMQTFLSTAIKISAPLLVLSMVVGIVIAIFQAATQIQEQTLTFVPKILLIALLLFVGGSWMLETLVDFTDMILLKMMQG